jgi:hypothetical protein
MASQQSCGKVTETYVWKFDNSGFSLRRHECCEDDTIEGATFCEPEVLDAKRATMRLEITSVGSKSESNLHDHFLHQ